MARLWHTILLVHWRSIFAYIPLESRIEAFQEQYYDAISKCHVQGNSNTFIEFMLTQIDLTLDRFMVQLENSGQESSEYVCRLNPAKIVMVSCDPATAARDTAALTSRGYTLRRLRPVDLFPRTRHVETVCLLSKLSGAKNTIDVKVDMDELDVTSAETKATYEEIKAYVLENSGLQVSSLYIAQVKRECGIIERENYNKAKSEDSRQPQYPEEKKKAIREALIHFGMI